MNVLRKVSTGVLMFSMLVSQPGMIAVVSAQEATRSAETTPTPTPFADTFVSVTNESSSSATPVPSIDPSPTSAPSATIRRKVRIRPLDRHSYRASESIEVVLESDPAAEFSASVSDKNGATAGIIVEHRESGGQRMIRLRPSGKLTPGTYTLIIRDWTGSVATETFFWGLVSVNTDQAAYVPGDRAKLRINIINEAGSLQCGMPVAVLITAPDGKTESFSTENSTVRQIFGCDTNTAVTASVYETEYVFYSSGTYHVIITATLSSGVEKVEDVIFVRDALPFVVSRAPFPDRIQPGQTVEGVIRITSKDGFEGNITETLPVALSVASSSAIPFTSVVSGVATQDGIKEGGSDPRRIRYPYDGSYPVTLSFGEKVADPDQKILYETFGLAGHDGVDFGLPKGTNVLAADDGVVALAGSGVYGITVVLQHSWGRTYYGHLSGTGLNVGQKIFKGDSLGLSGDTGLSTGPHLHFGLKLTTNDPGNGYYGKIDPSPFLSGKTLEDGYPVRVIGWNVSLRAGEMKEFRYRFTVPEIKPQTYLVGPVRAGGTEVEDGQFESVVALPEEEQVQGVSTQVQEEAGVRETSVIAKRKKNNPDIKETAADAQFRWTAELPNHTLFSFGRRNGPTVFPDVNIRTKDGWYLTYTHAKTPEPVISDARANRIEWQGYVGVTDRYSALEDRIKADYIVSSRQSIANNRLDFSVSFNHGLPADGETIEDAVSAGKGTLSPELLPTGDIVWVGEDWGELFRNPAPVVTDSVGKALTAVYEVKKEKAGTATISIVMQKEELDAAVYPVTVDPVTIDSAATTTAAAYGNGRKLLRDPYGNLIVLSDAGTGDDNVYYKNYSATSWTDAAVNLDGGAGSALEIAADIDGQANNESVHVAFRNSSDSDISYCKLVVTRNANNEITGIGSCSLFDLDTSDKAYRPSLIIVNKGEGNGKEKVAIVWAMNGTGGGKRGEIRFLQCDVSDGCDTAAEWKNASEEANGSGTCSDTGTGNAGLPNSTSCSGAADILFQAGTAGDKHHAVIAQMPGRPARTPIGAFKNVSSTLTNLTDALDDNTATVSDISNTLTLLYIGDSIKFSRVLINLTDINSSSIISSYMYCSANSDTGTTCDTWSSISNTVDNTLNSSIPSTFSEDGSYLFDEPSNWVESTEGPSAGTKAFWIRLSPNGDFDASVSVAEIDVTDRHSHDLLIVGGANSNKALGAAYVIWDFIGQAGWENIPGNTTAPAPWRQNSQAVSYVAAADGCVGGGGADWGRYTNFPLSSAVDQINNMVVVGYNYYAETFELGVCSFNEWMSILSKKNTTSITTQWNNTINPVIASIATDSVLSLTSDQNDVYVFYILDPGTNGLVYRKCNPRGGGVKDVCDNSSDWASGEKTLDSDTTLSHPQAAVSKSFGDTTAIDVIYTDTTDTDVRYERHFVNNADKTIVVAASGDDATHSDCVASTDFQDIDNSPYYLELGRRKDDASPPPQGYYCGSNDESENHVGIRFPNIPVNQGAAISSAYLDLRSSVEYSSTAIDFTIYGEDVDDSAAYTDVANCSGNGNCVNNRTKTTLNNPQSINFDVATMTYRFDVTDIVQEIICRGASNAQPCVGSYNGSGNWASGNDLSVLLVSAEGGAVTNEVMFTAFDDTSAVMLDPTLQINLGSTGKRYSEGVLKTPTTSVDLGHPMSTEEVSGVSTDDAVFASVSASLVPSASSSANPVFQFKVNNTNNNNTDNLSATAIVKSSIPPKTYPSGGGHSAGRTIYLQLYHTTNGWETKDSETATAADTEITLDSGTVTGSTSYYQSESPGGSCSGSDCWAAWRIYQDAGSEGNQIVYVDQFNATFTASGPTLDQLLRHGAWFNASGVEQPFTF